MREPILSTTTLLEGLFSLIHLIPFRIVVVVVSFHLPLLSSLSDRERERERVVVVVLVSIRGLGSGLIDVIPTSNRENVARVNGARCKLVPNVEREKSDFSRRPTAF